MTEIETIDTDDYGLRDELLASASARLLNVFAAAGVDASFPRAHGAHIQLYISLSSESGCAGIQMKPDVLAGWAELRTELRIDVI